MSATMEEVLDQHRTELGASHLHVDHVPGATPEEVDRVLRELRSEMSTYGAYRPEEQEAAKVARLRALLRKIDDLALRGETEEILKLTELVADVDLTEDTAWMRAEREKRGEPLPVPA